MKRNLLMNEYEIDNQDNSSDFAKMLRNDEANVVNSNTGDVFNVIIAPDNRLRNMTRIVTKIDKNVQTLIEDMFKVMEQSNGMGLAANQIGSDRRIIVMDVDRLVAYEDHTEQDTLTHGRFTIINPQIIEQDDRRVKWTEGCLSVPGFQFEIERSAMIKVKGLDEKGDKLEFTASGLLAAVIQHELDHLNGVLFIDHVSRLKRDIVISKLKKLRKKGSMMMRAHEAPLL